MVNQKKAMNRKIINDSNLNEASDKLAPNEDKTMKAKPKFNLQLKILIVIFSICCLVIILFFSAFLYCLKPPVFQYSENYEVSYESRDRLITRINHWKDKNSDYMCINRANYKINERSDDYYGYYYNVFFYFADINQTVHCIIMENPTCIRLVHVSEKRNGNFWTKINTLDLKRKDNNQIKNKFEKEILNSLGITWKRKGLPAGIDRFFSFLERYLLGASRDYHIHLG